MTAWFIYNDIHKTSFGTCVKFGPTQHPVGLGLGLGLRLELGLGLGLGPNLIDRKLGGPEPDTSAQVFAIIS